MSILGTIKDVGSGIVDVYKTVYSAPFKVAGAVAGSAVGAAGDVATRAARATRGVIVEGARTTGEAIRAIRPPQEQTGPGNLSQLQASLLGPGNSNLPLILAGVGAAGLLLVAVLRKPRRHPS